MSDPVTITAAGVGMAAISEGIKFLYGQAAELLKRWRERRDKEREQRHRGGGDGGIEAPVAKKIQAGAVRKNVEAHTRAGKGEYHERGEREQRGERPQPGEHARMLPEQPGEEQVGERAAKRNEGGQRQHEASEE